VQHLAQRIVLRGAAGPRVVVDAAGYRGRREDALRAEADRVAELVLSEGREIALRPMPAAERRFLHEYLRERGDVETHSEGDEPRAPIVSPVGLSRRLPRPTGFTCLSTVGRAFHVCLDGETGRDVFHVFLDGETTSAAVATLRRWSSSAPFERGVVVGILIGEGSFGGDGKQPQVTLRMHVRHEALFRWLLERFPRTRLYGPYGHGGRSYYQWMARGPALVEDVLPLLEDGVRERLDAHAARRLAEMRERYADYIARMRSSPGT
jgi:hypothetical protein